MEEDDGDHGECSQAVYVWSVIHGGRFRDYDSIYNIFQLVMVYLMLLLFKISIDCRAKAERWLARFINRVNNTKQQNGNEKLWRLMNMSM